MRECVKNEDLKEYNKIVLIFSIKYCDTIVTDCTIMLIQLFWTKKKLFVEESTVTIKARNYNILYGSIIMM